MNEDLRILINILDCKLSELKDIKRKPRYKYMSYYKDSTEEDKEKYANYSDDYEYLCHQLARDLEEHTDVFEHDYYEIVDTQRDMSLFKFKNLESQSFRDLPHD